MSGTRLPYRRLRGGLSITLKVTPNASRARIAGIEHDAEGAAYLKVMVTAPPEDGKANAAVVKLLAKAWGVPKSALSVTSGETSRHKEILLADEAQAVIDWMKQTLTNSDKEGAKGESS